MNSTALRLILYLMWATYSSGVDIAGPTSAWTHYVLLCISEPRSQWEKPQYVWFQQAVYN